MPVPWLRFPPSLNAFFSYFPHLLLLILSRLPPPQLVWLCFCYALGLPVLCLRTLSPPL